MIVVFKNKLRDLIFILGIAGLLALPMIFEVLDQAGVKLEHGVSIKVEVVGKAFHEPIAGLNKDRFTFKSPSGATKAKLLNRTAGKMK